MTKKLFVYTLYSALVFMPLTSISAFDRGGGGGGRSWPAQYNNRHYVDPNSYWNGGWNDGVVDNGAVIIDPNAGSGAGMTDDSDQLYQSYLNNFGTME